MEDVHLRPAQRAPNSARIARFICLLSNVAVVNTVPSLRHSRAATIRHSANAVKAIEIPTSTLARPASPTMRIMLPVSTDWPRGRGRADISPGVSLSNPRANPNAALTTKWIRRTCAGVKGSPAVMLNRLAPRKVRTNTTSRIRTKRMYFVRLS